jgi:hypothetical protein
MIANNPINQNIDENNNSFEEIDIIGNNNIDKNEIINTNQKLLYRKNQIDEKDLGDDSGALKRKNQMPMMLLRQVLLVWVLYLLWILYIKFLVKIIKIKMNLNLIK